MGNYAHEQFKSSSDWQIFSNYTGVDTKQLKTLRTIMRLVFSSITG